jgi:hypothetical protein
MFFIGIYFSSEFQFGSRIALPLIELLTFGISFGITETSRLSAARSLLEFSFLSHPLSYVWRAVHDLHPVGLARS